LATRPIEIQKLKFRSYFLFSVSL